MTDETTMSYVSPMINFAKTHEWSMLGGLDHFIFLFMIILSMLGLFLLFVENILLKAFIYTVMNGQIIW